MLTSKEVKDFALAAGADLVGIAPMSRFEGTEPGHDPRFIAPKAKALIGLGFRVLRGSLRGVEERTEFYQFPSMGVDHIDEVHAPGVLRRLACFLEDHGHEGVVQRSVPDRRRGDDTGVNPEHYSTFKITTARPVRPGLPAPDVTLDFKQAARLCGLGEIGLGGFFLTKRFGPLQRFAFVLTDAKLEPDPIPAPSLCDRCGKCQAACPGQAISKTGKLDEWQCSAYRMGADAANNPFLPPEAAKALPPAKRYDQASIEQCRQACSAGYPGIRFGYNAVVCGVACQRACLSALEERDVLQDKFQQPFRPRPNRA